MSETFQPIEQESNMVSEPTASQPYYTQSISPVDALWALYQAQTKKVRKAFRRRLLTEETVERKASVNKRPAQELSPNERLAAYQIAETIKKSATEVQQAAQNNSHVGRQAEDFLYELEQTAI